MDPTKSRRCPSPVPATAPRWSGRTRCCPCPRRRQLSFPGKPSSFSPAPDSAAMKIARLTLSDRAASGVYADESGPEIERIAAGVFAEPLEWTRVLLPDDRAQVETALRRLADDEGCLLIITTGGTGPSARDITPEATRAVIE